MITPVLLCGGQAARLWPLSRKRNPEQSAALVGGESLFNASAGRLTAADYAPPVVVNASDFRCGQRLAAGLDPDTVLIEPEGREVAPAGLAAAPCIGGHDPQALMLVAPSDHVVPDAEAFCTAVASGLKAARTAQIVTFGTTPTHVTTGYDWSELAGAAQEGQAAQLTCSVEKPPADAAEQLLVVGMYLRNGEFFLITAQVLIHADKRPADFLRDNLMIEANIIHAAWEAGVEKLLFHGSCNIYSREAPQPIREEHLLTGPLEPTKLYGPRGIYDPERNHVLPALLRNLHEAREAGAATVMLWGSGRPLQEFLDVDVLADALVFLLRTYSGPVPVNVGSGTGVSMRELAEVIAEPAFDSTKPGDTPRKLQDCSQLHGMGWNAAPPLRPHWRGR